MSMLCVHVVAARGALGRVVRMRLRPDGTHSTTREIKVVLSRPPASKEPDTLFQALDVSVLGYHNSVLLLLDRNTWRIGKTQEEAPVCDGFRSRRAA